MNFKPLKEKILQKSAEKFLTLGVKSVTMDEIASELGMSKKTLYTHFSTKTELINATTHYVFEEISKGINEIVDRNKNPIEEHYKIKNFALEHLKYEKSSPQYQLQKYYPKIFTEIRKKQQKLMEDLIRENLEKGIKEGYYREEISIPFISRIYFVEMIGLKDRDLFPADEFPVPGLIEEHLEYHLRGIVTNKGLTTLKNYLQNNN
ncbi:TetR family transcriptional regulator [Salinimicrobium marinum]|uniref:TetR family transcriptional regulator n=1 Tax=Salinimicrobium marinum TaxID=680283 RepID=A0A918S690_9FLAO|nr:TetR family transcriptional regulator [Salinimicrobium marinum]